MPDTLILGGGFGGIACARALSAGAGPGHRITVVDRSPDFLVGAAKTWVMLGEREPGDATRPRQSLLPAGVEFVQAEIVSIDPARHCVETTAGRYQAEALVIALGADLDPGAVPGMADAAHTFYTLEGATRLRAALEGFRGGRVVLLIPSLPFKCPPAPYEAAMLLDWHLRRRGARDSTSVEIWTVEKAPMTTAGPEMGKAIVGELAARGIGFQPLRRTAAVDGARRTVRFEDGSETPFDLLIAIPPHRVPRVILEAGLTGPSGWIPVDPKTLEVTGPAAAPGVYAIGDVTSVALPGRHDPSVPLSLPKAGVFAAAEGETVAAAIAARRRGAPAQAGFDGRGFCFLEVGGGRAMRAEGSFFEQPHPVMSAQPASESQYRDKLAWVESWLGAVRG